MLNKSLIHYFVDGWDCVPSQLFALLDLSMTKSSPTTLNSILTLQRVADDKRGLSELRWFKTRVQKSPVRISRFTGVCGCCFLLGS